MGSETPQNRQACVALMKSCADIDACAFLADSAMCARAPCARLALALEACHTVFMIFADREPEWRCTAAACGAVGSTCAIRPEEWE
ncbi:hypothetical protein AHAS_Ahas20G0147400 [Arachis hypogaea]